MKAFEINLNLNTLLSLKYAEKEKEGERIGGRREGQNDREKRMEGER